MADNSVTKGGHTEEAGEGRQRENITPFLDTRHTKGHEKVISKSPRKGLVGEDPYMSGQMRNGKWKK